MLKRAVVLGSLPLLCAACANEPAPRVLGYQASVPATMQTSRSGDLQPAGNGETQPVMKKNMADKVLAAIALERVTGRKPDPSRLIE